MIRWPVAVLALFGIASTCGAATRLVPAQFPTIQLAIDAAVAGDEVVVSAGTYAEAVQLVSKDDLVVRASGNVTIDATTQNVDAFVVVGCTATEVRGFKILPAANRVGLRVTNGSGVEVRTCRVVGGSPFGIQLQNPQRTTLRNNRVEDGGGVDAAGTSLAIINNKILRSTARGIHVTGTAILVQGNTVTESTTESIQVEAGGSVELRDNTLRDGGGIVLQECDGSLIEANRVVRAAAEGIVVNDIGAVLLKNIVQDAGTQGIALNVSDTILRANRVLGANASGVALGANADTGVLDANVIKSSDASGFAVTPGAAGNLFFKNIAKGNAVFDLDDDAPAQNLYILNQIAHQKKG